MKRYEAIATRLANDIRSGALPCGSRLPSVRQATVRYGVGQSTVLRAYHLLEEWCLIQARERSGYFVRSIAIDASAEKVCWSEYVRPGMPSTRSDSDIVFDARDFSQQHGVIPFGSNYASANLFPSQRLARSVAKATRLLNSQSPGLNFPPGNELLRRQTAVRFVAMGLDMPFDEVIITDGASEALNLCLQAVTRPGDLVAIESPGFYGARLAIERLGLQAIEIPVDDRDGLDIDVLAAALKTLPIRACWFMPNVQQPTGITMSLEKKHALVGLLARYDIPLLEDDVFGDIYFRQGRPAPAKSFDRKGLVMYCGSYSKCLAPGYRLGWSAAGRFSERVRRLKIVTTEATSMPIQEGVADYLQHGGYERHLRKLRSALQNNLCAMDSAIARWLPQDVSYITPDGGHHIWLKLPERCNSDEIFVRACASGISIAPGSMFSTKAEHKRYMRLNFGHSWSNELDNGLRTLGGLIQEGALQADCIATIEDRSGADGRCANTL